MNGYTLTRIWQVDNKLVVAKTIEEAINIFRAYWGENLGDAPRNVKAIGSRDYCISDYDAIIKED